MSKKWMRLAAAGLVLAIAGSLAACGSSSTPAANDKGSQGAANSGSEKQASQGEAKKDDAKQGEAKVTIRLAFPSGKGSMLYEAGYMYADLVKERSKGEIDVKVFPDGQLGKDLAVLDAMKLGSIEMSIPSTVLAQKAPEFGVFDIPFLFENRDKVAQIANGDIWNKDLKALLPAQGLVGLGFWENGFRQITNNKRPINVPDDLNGLKMRVPESKIRVAMFKELGANASPLDFSEVFTALQQGVFDGQENPLPTIKGGKFEEVQKYLSITNHVYTPAYLVASKVWWDKLTPEQQKLLSDIAVEVGDKVRVKGQQADDELLGYFKSKGMEINNADIKAFKQKTAPVLDILKETIDPAFIDKVIKAAE